MSASSYDFVLEMTTQKTTRQAIVALWKSAQAHGWIIVNDNDLSGLLGNGSVDIKSIGICHPDLARPFLESDFRTGLCMPCNVLVYRDGDITRIVAMRPNIVMPKIFPTIAERVQVTAEAVDEALRKILETAVNE